MWVVAATPAAAGLEEASRLYFGESNVEGMLNTLLPLHELLDKAGPTTLKEIAFVQSYGREVRWTAFLHLCTTSECMTCHPGFFM